MSDFAQSYASAASPLDNTFPSSRRANGHSASLSAASHRARMPHERNGAMPMPVGYAQRTFSRMSSEGVGGMLPGGIPARSPPKPNKNTQHVPCKFFLQGQCQAGSACPFSHDVASSVSPQPCRYFSKGHCKFGRKCALLHITPDGTVINNRMQSFQGPQYLPGAPPSASQYSHAAPPPPGLLSLQAHALEPRASGEFVPPDFDGYQYAQPPHSGYDAPQIDMTYTSASPTYGSPPQNEHAPSSPSRNALSVLDAPLPNSFDSNGISWAARHGHLAASVPSRFGIESPPASLPRKTQMGGTALRDLRTSAFGDRGMDNVLASMGSSPTSGTDEPLVFEKRPLHSDRLRASRQVVSASLGTRLPTQSFDYSDDDEEDDPDREEDLLPYSLHDLIPEGRARKDSRSRLDDNKPAMFLAAQRRTISGHATPQDSKVGSPSRYTNMFARTTSNGFGHGHIGSPLRDSGFPAPTPSRLVPNGDMSPTVSSPPRQASMSMLTQGLQRTKLEARAHQQAGPRAQASLPTRTLSNGSSGPGRQSLDRSASVGHRIDEDQELFDMDGLGAPSEGSPRSLTNGSLPRDEHRFGPIGPQKAK